MSVDNAINQIERTASTILLCRMLAVVSLAQTEFQKPWADPSKALVIDPYQGNPIDWEKLALDNRVVGIIHRATSGLKADEKYMERKREAVRRGYKWGSYHLAKPGDPILQADSYLKLAKPAYNEVVVLDIEGIDPKKDMSLDDAVIFIDRVEHKLGRYPVVYANHTVVSEIAARFGNTNVFSKTPLWYARFKDSIPDLPHDTWPTYTLWQFSCEINCAPGKQCLYRVPGTESDMDVDVFNGTVKELRAKWPFTFKARQTRTD